MRAITTGLLAVAFCAGCEAPVQNQASGGGGGLLFFGGGVATVGAGARLSELSGGTLTLDRTGAVAAISDPDRDQVVVMDLESGAIRGRVLLPARSRPGRGTLDRDGNFVITLRGSGEVATITARGGSSGRRPVCGEPIGVAYDASASALLVACATGELVALPDDGSKPVWAEPAPDLRDVVVAKGKRWVTTFRSAQVLPLSTDFVAGTPITPPSSAIGSAGSSFTPAVGWRTVGLSSGGLVIAHQRHVTGDIAAIQPPAAPATPAYYTNPCSSPVVRSALTVFAPDGTVSTSFEVAGALPVDVAVSPDESRATLVLAGSRRLVTASLSQASSASSTCVTGSAGIDLPAEPVAAVYRPDGTLVVQSHNPPELLIIPANGAELVHHPFNEAPADDTGYTFFHTAATGGLACASCHPEGRDDGHTWTFIQGPVRTQSLAGGLSSTAPYHWKGNLADLPALLDETFVLRMGGTKPENEVVSALKKWLDGIPDPGAARVTDVDAVDRGEHLFAGAAGCGACHSGALYTDAQTVDVGTGGRFQVPSLRGLRSRGPWMHNGCAHTLADRFDPTCGGTAHGSTSTLDAGQRSDLLSYLESL